MGRRCNSGVKVGKIYVKDNTWFAASYCWSYKVYMNGSQTWSPATSPKLGVNNTTEVTVDKLMKKHIAKLK